MKTLRGHGQVCRWMTLGFLLGGCLTLAQRVSADGSGTSGAPFLKIGMSARAEAMGGAVTAVVDDVDATYWNPAGLMQLQRSTIGLSHLEWFQDIRYECLSYADKYDYVGAIGVQLGYLYLGDIPKTLETASGDYDSVHSGGTFGASALALSFAWAGQLAVPENAIGIGVKIIQESIDENASFSVGVDIGDQFLLSQHPGFQEMMENNWSMHLLPDVIGFSIRNLGMPVKFFNQNDPLPLSTTLGIAYQFLEKDLIASLDLAYQVVEGELGLHMGLEYWLNAGMFAGINQDLEFALRVGYRTGYDVTSAPGLALGMGVRYEALGLDYVFVPFGDLGMTHRLSLKYSWGDILLDKGPLKSKNVARGTVPAAEDALDETAQRMVKSKRSMEGKVVVQKSPQAKRDVTAVEAKKPEESAVVQETKSQGAAINESGEANITHSVAIAKGVVIKNSGARIDSALIEKITQSKKPANGSESRYTRRTKDDVARSARREAEVKNSAFDAIEEAAKDEVQQSRNLGRKLVTRTTVYFASNNSQLSDRYLFALDQIAITYDHFPQRTILVHGYASEEETNKTTLALKRAKAVKDYLVQIKSIPNNKISLRGFGDKDPVSRDNTPKGRAMNRRVRIELISSGN